MSKLLTNFLQYLKKKDVISLAIGVMLAGSAAKLTSSLVEDLFKPLVDPLINKVTSSGDLASWKLSIGPFHLRIGSLIQNLVEFLIIGIVIVTIGTTANKYF
jgi:large conductance mechanosensitive channel protein